MRDAVICEPIRTPVGRFGGAFRHLTAADLASHVIHRLLERAGVAPERVDDVLLGQGYPDSGAPAIGRVAALDAGLPVEVPGLQVDRRCGSGLQAIIQAAMQVQTGASDLVVAGGAESMSQVGYDSSPCRFGASCETVNLHDRLARARVTAGGRAYRVEGGMVETAENLRAAYQIPREEQDALALESHRRAVAAQTEGRFADEIVPVALRGPDGGTLVERDEHPRPDTSLDQLGRLRPIRSAVDPGATVTAGNASGQNDAAAVCLVTTPALADDLSLRPLGRLASWAVAGVDPRRMGLGPVPATAKALGRLDLRLADVDLIELNEAFAAQVLAVTREWQLAPGDFGRLNVNGSGISLGHPIGATGARIAATLLWEMDRRGARYGLETMCIGGGQGLAAVFERV